MVRQTGSDFSIRAKHPGLGEITDELRSFIAAERHIALHLVRE
jgi:hypothetical protein